MCEINTEAKVAEHQSIDWNTRTFTAEKDNVKVELAWIGEGVSGDYNNDDPEDEPLVRFDVSRKESSSTQWEEVSDASYCTNLSAKLPANNLQFAADYILNLIFDEVMQDHSIKRACEQISWIDESVFGAYPASINCSKVKIVVEVSGGCVQNVYSSNPNFEYIIVDHDDIEYDDDDEGASLKLFSDGSSAQDLINFIS